MGQVASENPHESVEIFDSRLSVLTWVLLCVGLLLSSTYLWDWGAFGVLLFGPQLLYASARLLSRPVRLQITEEGVVDRVVWPYAGFIPWEEIIEFRSQRLWVIEIRLRDEDAFLRRQSLMFYLSRMKALYRGWSPAILWTPFLTGPKKELLAQLDSGLEAFTLASIHRELIRQESGPETS
jgi:hypothetical protein